MSYIEKQLGNGEEVVLKIKKNWAYLLPGFLWLIIFIAIGVLATVLMNNSGHSPSIEKAKLYIWIFAIAIGMFYPIKKLITFLSLSLAVTNKRVIGKVGLLKVYSFDIPIDKIDNITIGADFWGRLFRYYYLTIHSVGGSGYAFGNGRGKKNLFKLVAISNAQNFKNTVTEAIEQHAEEARRAQAAAIASAMYGFKN